MSVLSKVVSIAKVPKLLYQITNGYKTAMGLGMSLAAVYLRLAGGPEHATAGEQIQSLIDALVNFGIDPLLTAGEVLSVVGSLDKVRKAIKKTIDDSRR